MPWSSNPLPSRACTQSCTKLNPDSSKKVWLALEGLPPGVWAYLRTQIIKFLKIHEIQAYMGSVPSRASIQSIRSSSDWACSVYTTCGLSETVVSFVCWICQLDFSHLSSGMISKQNLLSIDSAAFLIHDFSLKLSVLVILASRWLYGIIQKVLVGEGVMTTIGGRGVYNVHNTKLMHY